MFPASLSALSQRGGFKFHTKAIRDKIEQEDYPFSSFSFLYNKLFVDCRQSSVCFGRNPRMHFQKSGR